MARAKSDIDPLREDVADRRARPAPAVDNAEKAKRLTRVRRLPGNPGVMLEPEGGEGWRTTSPHADGDLWELQLAECFGTRSQSLLRVFLDNLKGLVPQDYDEEVGRWKANETELNAALAMVAGASPKSVHEAMLAAQMVAVHWMQMRVSAQALNGGGLVMPEDAALASKLARTFTMQIDALRGMKGGKRSVRQTITVKRESHIHRHIHVHRGAEEGDEQSQATRTRVLPKRATLPGPSEGNGEVVPFTSRKGS